LATVFIRKASYQYEDLKPLLFGLLKVLDQDRIRKGSRVLIKPNFLAPASQTGQ
jgi:uncharacterized protein (DUF362 family)